jgi:hypothetical protein
MARTVDRLLDILPDNSQLLGAEFAEERTVEPPPSTACPGRHRGLETVETASLNESGHSLAGHPPS